MRRIPEKLDAKKDMGEKPGDYNGWTYDRFLELVGPDVKHPITPRTVMAELMKVNRKKVYRMLESVLRERGH